MRRVLASLLAVSCAVCAATAAASFSPGVGRGGDDNRSASRCPKGQPLTGFYGGVGDAGATVVGRIGALCEDGPKGRLIGSLGAGGDTERHRCPSRAVAIGIRARFGNLVDRVQLICQGMNLDGKLSGSTRLTGSMGGSGGDERGRVKCPPGQHATGFRGSIQTESKGVDFLQLHCTR